MATLAQMEKNSERDKREIERLKAKHDMDLAAIDAMKQVQDLLPKTVTPGARMAGTLATAGLLAIFNGALPWVGEAYAPAVLLVGGVAGQMVVESPELQEVTASLTAGAGSVFTYVAGKTLVSGAMNFLKGTPAKS